MSLSPLLKHVYNNASDEVIRRGKKIFHTSGVYITEHDLLTDRIIFRVRNDIYKQHYRVTVNNFISGNNINTRCQCSFKMGIVCPHEAAALFQLNELIQSGFFDNLQKEYNQSHTILRMRQISEHHLRMVSSDVLFEAGVTLSKKKSAIKILSAADETVTAKVTDDNKSQYDVVIRQNEERYFDTKCGCDETKHPICIHKLAVFLKLFKENSPLYFNSLRNWDKEKSKLLALYGYTLEDDLQGKFEFAFVDGRLSLRVMDLSIKKLSDPKHPDNIKKAEEQKANPEIDENHIPIVILQKEKTYYPNFQYKVATAEFVDRQIKGPLAYPDPTIIQSSITVDDQTKRLILTLQKVNYEELIKSLKRDLPFGEFVSNIEKRLSADPDTEMKQQVFEYYWQKLSKINEQFHEWPNLYYLPYDKSLTINNLENIQFSEYKFSLIINVKPVSSKKQPDIALHTQIILNESILKPEQYTLLNELMLLHEGKLHIAENIDVAMALLKYDLKNELIIKADEWEEYLKNDILQIDHKIVVTFHKRLRKDVKNEDPNISIHIKEIDDNFIFQPVFNYHNIEKLWQDEGPAVIPENGKVTIYQRNEASEQSFLTFFRYLHPNLKERRRLNAFVLSSKEVLKRGWYFEFLELMSAKNIPVRGIEQLKQMRINPNKPVANIQFTSGIDWFEAFVKISFGDQNITVAEVKKALAKETNLVKLKDGSQGLLTEDFIEKYGLMFKMGKVIGDKLRISKIHFTAIEGLTEGAENETVNQEIEEKKNRLLTFNYENISKLPLPENLNAKLRRYQIAGYDWMAFLHDTGWGGILADDMGLGKTVQTLSTFLRHYNINKKSRFLVVCPTTLIYNWENESKKFTPDLSYHIYHGPNRHQYKDELQKSNLIITTYGTLRSDIDILSRIEWDYAVLDESQAIKNPLSQVAKAALKLNAKNRLALSGTPIQNNTFDLFAQMDFLNPGMLGSIDFFKNEFAIPIDKMQDEAAKKHLRKMIYPFLLRRTKEQVAPDLPEKTETILYCEMEEKQRSIYNAYRNRFRSQILGSIEEVGIERSQMSILTGLMKLRQICDSPAIIKEPEKYENHSIKLEELSRELQENTTQHKSLVFSQFLGMLDLIRKELKRLKIPFVYFDGSTTSKEREKAIKEFQENDDCKVFLISLKAGGVGLNLTAADYVYIVDPWWNPAVEQQAIDRTHRIGQTKKIFAYRMICKDTIEEKIMLLQERKLTLVKDLISDEKAFLKKLTKEDVEYLLS